MRWTSETAPHYKHWDLDVVLVLNMLVIEHLESYLHFMFPLIVLYLLS